MSYAHNQARMHAMRIHLHTHACAHTLIYVLAYTHAYVHTCLRTHMLAYTHAYVHKKIACFHTHACVHTCLRSRMLGYTRAHTHTHMHACTRILAYTHSNRATSLSIPPIVRRVIASGKCTHLLNTHAHTLLYIHTHIAHINTHTYT